LKENIALGFIADNWTS